MEASVIPVLYQDWLLLLKLEAPAFRRGEESLSVISACSKVPVGYEGIKVNKLGSDKGVVETPLSTGRYFLTFNEELYIFPIHTKTTVWEDQPNTDGNESFNISTKDGGKFRINAGITFKVIAGESPKVLSKWRSDIDTIENTHFKRLIQDAFTKEGSKYSAFEVMGKRTEIKENVELYIKPYLAEYGIDVEQVFLIDVDPPEAIKGAMNAKMAAEEKTAQVMIQIKEAEANAQIAIAKAKGEADAINIKGDALRNNPEVLKLEIIQKWDGKLPSVTNGDANGFIINLEAIKD